MASFGEAAQQLLGALSGQTYKKQGASGGDPNDGSAKARAQQEYKAASQHYSNVQSATKDKGELDRAHKRLMDASAALAQFH